MFHTGGYHNSGCKSTHARVDCHWHWQWAYGNGDIGNQGPHQLDVARWALGSPQNLPLRVMSFGNRWGYSDDGQTANNQMALYDYGKGNVPLLFDNRGLPAANMEWGKSQKDGRMPVYYVSGQGKGGQTQIGNVFHCESAGSVPSPPKIHSRKQFRHLHFLKQNPRMRVHVRWRNQG